MILRRTTCLLVAAVVVAASCARNDDKPALREFELGTHQVQAIVPEGWESLDQGRQKRFRKGELEIVLENLGRRTPAPRDLDELIDWALTELGHNQRREVKSRRALTIDGRDAWDVETWSRLDHTWPQRMLFVRGNDDVIALHTARMADEQTLKAFETIRNSFHFAASTRR